MKYLINNEIIYESDGRILSHKTSPENPVLLSETAGRLLTRLLEEPNTALHRNIIIQDVWDKYGYSGSGNSLNQYISLLRRNLTLLGADDVIQTIPKMGFFLNATVTSIAEDEQNTASVSTSDISLRASENGPVAKVRKSSKNVILLSFIIAVTVITLFVVFLLNRPDTFSARKIDDVVLHPIGTLEGCPVYTTAPFSTEYRQKIMDNIRELAKGNLSCIGSTFMLFDAEDLYVINNEGTAFLTACTFESKSTSKLAGCRDIYVNK